MLSLLSNSLFNTPIDISDIDLEKIAYEAKMQAVLPLAVYKLIGDEESNLQQQTFTIISNNMIIDWNHVHVHNLMRNANIPYVILKGYSSAHYYPDPVCRTMGDVDFLVAKKDLKRVDEILRADGFELWKKRHICHIVYRKADVYLEVHFEPAGVPKGKAGELVRSYFEDIFDTSVQIETDDGTFVVPDNFHHGLVLLLHTCHHLTGEGIGLRQLCDWAVFANSLSNDEFKILFEHKLKTIGLWRFAQLLTQISIRYLGMPEKEWAMENVDEELLNSIIKDIFTGGNFGAKDAQRISETLIISSRGKNGVGNSSMLRQLFISMNQIVYTKWPISKKLKILLPFGWCFYGGRYIVRMLLGKRKKINVNKVISSAKKRREIYKEFHLYEL